MREISNGIYEVDYQVSQMDSARNIAIDKKTGKILYKYSEKLKPKTVYDPSIHNQKKLTTNVQNKFESTINQLNNREDFLKTHTQLQMQIDGNKIQTYFEYDEVKKEVKITNYHHEK